MYHMTIVSECDLKCFGHSLFMRTGFLSHDVIFTRERDVEMIFFKTQMLLFQGYKWHITNPARYFHNAILTPGDRYSGLYLRISPLHRLYIQS